jgi:hypothetical protein
LILFRSFGNVAGMQCGHRAILVVTRTVEGTSTTVARRRIELSCGLTTGHTGPHRDLAHPEEWLTRASTRPTLLRHEEDEP